MKIIRKTICYKGEPYQAVVVEDKSGVERIIASMNLYDQMCPHGIEYGYADDDAEHLDEEIYGYVMDFEFDTDEKLMAAMKEIWDDEDIFDFDT